MFKQDSYKVSTFFAKTTMSVLSTFIYNTVALRIPKERSSTNL